MSDHDVYSQCDNCGQIATLDYNGHCIVCSLWQALLDEARGHVAALEKRWLWHDPISDESYCIHCNAWQSEDGTEYHADNCPLVAARAWLARTEGESKPPNVPSPQDVARMYGDATGEAINKPQSEN